MKIINCEQGTDEWHQCRLGKVTASKFKDVISGGQGKVRKSYMLSLAAQRLTGLIPESYTNAYMEWGTEHEPQARAMYELVTGNTVNEVGFCVLDDNVGVSPDGLIANDGLIEIKCPKTETHIETVMSGKMPSQYKAQVQGQLWVTDRKWCDFVSFDPRIDGDKSLFIITVKRDDDYIFDLTSKIGSFVGDLIAMTEYMRK